MKNIDETDPSKYQIQGQTEFIENREDLTHEWIKKNLMTKEKRTINGYIWLCIMVNKLWLLLGA